MIPADPLANLGPATIVRGNARALPLPDASVDLIVTSPPYFALRSYTDGGAHYDGQIGSEATPAEFVEALLECTREMVRVLKPTGSCWINLGDKYAQATERSRNGHDGALVGTNPLRDGPVYSGRKDNGVPTKSLLGMPWRYALACIDGLGLILRAEVIWSKPNGLPESVTDRVRRSHETWFHFTKEPRYFAAVDEIREQYDTADRVGTRSSYKPGQTSGNTLNGHTSKSDAGLPLNPLGKLPGSVREVPSAPLTVPAHLGVDHFAAFPPAWPAWIIRGWSPSGICTVCGEGRRPVTEVDNAPTQSTNNAAKWSTQEIAHGNGRHRRPLRASSTATIIGYACACPTLDAPTRPAVVLDPFGGTGTTAMAARALGRHGISVDLSADYCRLARWRVSDLDQLAAVRGLPRTGRTDDQQPSLLDLIDGEAS